MAKFMRSLCPDCYSESINMCISVFFMWLVFVSMWTSAVQAQQSEIPVELASYAKQQGCLPIAEFYRGYVSDDEIAKHPPPYPNVPRSFVYGYSKSGKKKDSAVFWCEDAKPSGTPYHLLFYFKDAKLDTDGCPNAIRNIGEVAGLTIVLGPLKSLDGFVNVDGSVTDPPNSANYKPDPTRNIVMSAFDDIGKFYYCHEGKWLVRDFGPH